MRFKYHIYLRYFYLFVVFFYFYVDCSWMRITAMQFQIATEFIIAILAFEAQHIPSDEIYGKILRATLS